MKLNKKNIPNLEQVKAEQARRSLYRFVKEFWSEIEPEEFQDNWHIKYICDEIQIVAERVFKREPKLYDLVINIPPGQSKSTIVTVMAPAWFWANDQTIRTIDGTVSSEGIASASWTMNQTDFDNAENAYPCGDEAPYYEFYFEVGSIQSSILNVYKPVVGEPTAYWMDDELTQILSSDGVSSSALPHSYAMVIDNSGLPEGAVTFTIEEDDSGEGLLNFDDSIKTVSGTVDSDGRALALLELSQTDYESADDDGDSYIYEDYPEDTTYEFMFKIGSIESANLALTFPLGVLGDPIPYWADVSSGAQITTFDYQSSAGVHNTL